MEIIRLPTEEYAKIVGEINTNYGKYKSRRRGVHASYGIDGVSYLYYFVNLGYDEYLFYNKVVNKG